MIKLGGFGLIRDYDAIRNAGFDYAELDMPEIEALDERSFCTFEEHVKESGFSVPTGARILPIAQPLFFTSDYREKELASYLYSSCRKSAKLGVQKILFGNGKARSLIDEGSIGKEKVFIGFLRMLCEIAGENGQEVLIEPLGPKYSNYIQTLPEAARVIDLAGMDNLFAMADLRHFVWSNEAFEDIVRYREIVHHVHVDYPLSYPERKYPSVQDDYDYTPFFAQLENYSGLMTVEADIPLDWMKAGTDARMLVKAYWKKEM